MKEISDDELDGLRTQLSCYSPLVQSLVVNIDRVEEENVFLLNAMKDACKILGRNEPPETWEVNTLRAAAVNTASGNTALRERVKRMEEALRSIPACSNNEWASAENCADIAEAALKEGE